MNAEDDVRAFMVEDLRVLSAQAEWGSLSDEPVVKWDVKFYDPDPDFGEDEPRVVTATLHAHGTDGWATVTAGALFTGGQRYHDTPSADVTRVIAGSVALESLYDFARSHLRVLAGIVDGHLDVPYKAPIAEVEHGSITKDDAVVEAQETTDSTR